LALSLAICLIDFAVGRCFTKYELLDTSEIDVKEGNFKSNNVIFQILGKVTRSAKSSSDPMPQTSRLSSLSKTQSIIDILYSPDFVLEQRLWTFEQNDLIRSMLT